jgi:pyruvate-formate lyase-activating enzyme
MSDDWTNNLKKVEKRMDEVSSSFCSAKWLQVTMNLTNGFNHSCHHPKQHKVPVSEVEADPAALHNSIFKKIQRHKMLTDKRPEECQYCWNIEDTPGDHFSDRILKSSEPWAIDRLDEVANHKVQENIAPSYLEVMFSHTCNFKCIYCAPHISSSIMQQEKEFGEWPMGHTHLPTVEREGALPLSLDEEENPYVKAFWKWLPTIYKDLKVLRITGGEPLLSPSTFKVLDYINNSPKHDLELAINSNLNATQKKIDELTDYIKKLYDEKKFKSFHLYTSVDTYGEQAEYIRGGMSYETVFKNLELFLNKVPELNSTIMCTFNILSIPRFKDFLKDVLALKKKLHTKGQWSTRLFLDVSMLNYPKSLSAIIAPRKIRETFINSVNFAKSNIITEKVPWGFNDAEINKITRLFNWLTTEENVAAHNIVVPWEKQFYQYIFETDRRNKTDFIKTFPEYSDFIQDLGTKYEKKYSRSEDEAFYNNSYARLVRQGKVR